MSLLQRRREAPSRQPDGKGEPPSYTTTTLSLAGAASWNHESAWETVATGVQTVPAGGSRKRPTQWPRQ